MQKYLRLHNMLKHQLDNTCSIFVQNGYPEFLIDFRLSKKLLHFQQNAGKGLKMFCLLKVTMDRQKFSEI